MLFIEGVYSVKYDKSSTCWLFGCKSSNIIVNLVKLKKLNNL